MSNGSNQRATIVKGGSVAEVVADADRGFEEMGDVNGI